MSTEQQASDSLLSCVDFVHAFVVDKDTVYHLEHILYLAYRVGSVKHRCVDFSDVILLLHNFVAFIHDHILVS